MTERVRRVAERIRRTLFVLLFIPHSAFRTSHSGHTFVPSYLRTPSR
jgi:hypothetical protein